MGNKNVSEIINQGQKVKIDISQIKVPDYHDRTDVDDESIESLANNMSEVGQLSPILLDKKSNDDFDLISGLRRYEAALKLNWTEIDAIVLEDLDEQGRMLIMIAENAQRQDINDFDLVNSLIHFLAVSNHKPDDEVKNFLFKLKKSMEENLSKTDRYTLSFVINKLRVLNFSPSIIKAMKEHRLLYSYGLMLNKIKDEQIINELLHKFMTKQIDKDELKKEIKKYIASEPVDQVVPFGVTLKKLRDFKSFPEDKKEAISYKMQEIEDILAS